MAKKPVSKNIVWGPDPIRPPSSAKPISRKPGGRR